MVTEVACGNNSSGPEWTAGARKVNNDTCLETICQELHDQWPIQDFYIFTHLAGRLTHLKNFGTCLYWS